VGKSGETNHKKDDGEEKVMLHDKEFFEVRKIAKK
jgi:hypothetical protein